MKLTDILREVLDDFKFRISTVDERTTISIDGVGEVVVTETYPAYEFVDDIGDDGLDELDLDEYDMIGKIEHIEINDEYKSKGYGKILMQKAIEYAEKNGLTPIYLNASPMGFNGLNSHDLEEFYKSFGFEAFLYQGHNKLMIRK